MKYLDYNKKNHIKYYIKYLDYNKKNHIKLKFLIDDVVGI